jgi:tripartite-type tricarboxylate transporter receptor subunit TctC
MKVLRAVAVLAAALMIVPQAFAQSYPTKPVKIVVPFTPGGFNDTLGRTFAQKFTEMWGVPVVVDNKPGGNTSIGTDFVAKSAPDGYTLQIIGFPFAVHPSLMKSVPYDIIRDFQPIILAADTPNLLVVHPSVPAKTVAELIALAKAQPKTLNYASTGNGTSNHMSMELFKMMTKTDIVHVPYKGSAPAVTDLLGGQVQVMFDNVPNVIGHVKTGRLRALGVSGTTRARMAPDVPTVIEGGVPGYEVSVWFGLAAPAGTPADIIRKIHADAVKVLAMPDVRERFQAQGVEARSSTPEQFAEYIKSQKAMWQKVADEAGVKPD